MEMQPKDSHSEKPREVQPLSQEKRQQSPKKLSKKKKWVIAIASGLSLLLTAGGLFLALGITNQDEAATPPPQTVESLPAPTPSVPPDEETVPDIDLDAIQNWNFSSIEGIWTSDDGHRLEIRGNDILIDGLTLATMSINPLRGGLSLGARELQAQGAYGDFAIYPPGVRVIIDAGLGGEMREVTSDMSLARLVLENLMVYTDSGTEVRLSSIVFYKN
jgi:hypothetical protein